MVAVGVWAKIEILLRTKLLAPARRTIPNAIPKILLNRRLLSLGILNFRSRNLGSAIQSCTLVTNGNKYSLSDWDFCVSAEGLRISFSF